MCEAAPVCDAIGDIEKGVLVCACCVHACVRMLAVCVVYVCRIPLIKVLMVGRQHCRQKEPLYYLAPIELEPIV